MQRISFLLSLALPLAAATPGSWSATGSLNVARTAQAQVSLSDGRVLVAGGTSGTAPVASAEIYNYVTATWTLTGSMSTPRTNATAVLLANGKVLVAGGSTGSTVVASAEIFDPSTGTWTLTGSMNAVRSLESLTLLASGKVLATGGCPVATGCSYANALATAELYDPASGTWTPTGSISDPIYGVPQRFGQASLLLSNGKVLVTPAGGSNQSINPALYDPATGTWTLVYSHYQYPAYNGNLTQLSDGRIMMLGGYIGTTQGTEFFNPTTNTWTVGPAIGVWSTNFSVMPMANGQMILAGGGYTMSIGSGRGGGGSRPILNANSLVFTPSANTFSPGGAGVVIRTIPHLSALPNGEVLAVGGAATTVTEVYMPANTISLSTTSLTFPSQLLFQTSPAQTVTLTNLEPALSLGINSVTTTGAFAVTNNCPASLAPTQSCSVSVTSTPTTAGSNTGSLNFSLANAPFTATVSLTGTGLAQALTLSTPTLALSAPAGASSTGTVTVTNSSPTASPVTVAASGTGFAQTNNCPASLAAGASCLVTVAFSPAGLGTYYGSLAVTGTGGTQTVALTGTGGAVALAVSPLSISFGAVQVNDNPTKTITIQNPTAVAFGLNIQGSGAPFNLTTNCTASLAAGKSCTITVEFIPTAYVIYNGTVTITDSTGTVNQVSLVGVGTN